MATHNENKQFRSGWGELNRHVQFVWSNRLACPKYDKDQQHDYVRLPHQIG